VKPAGAGKSDVTLRLIHAADKKPVAEARPTSFRRSAKRRRRKSRSRVSRANGAPSARASTRSSPGRSMPR
jgi:hypothetical protein